MKVSTSASYYNLPIIRAILMTCDTIYTSMATNEQTLKDMFGEHKIIIGRAPQEFPAGVEVHTFSSNRRVIKKALEAGDQETGKLLTEYCGWRQEGNLWLKHGHNILFKQVGNDLPVEVIEAMSHCF